MNTLNKFEKLMSTLYIVATPIGNLEDISLRALRVLREVKLIAAEDTRRTRKLLVTYEIKMPTTSYHEHNKWAKLDYILSCLDDGDVALVSNAGTPGVSDPGYELVVAARQRGIRVVPVPGPSAIMAALAVSGMPADRFNFIGFLPHQAGSRRRLLESVAGESGTIVALETPHRLLASLDDMQLPLGDRRIAVCRELTKFYEEVFQGTISQAREHFAEPKGEFTLVIEGRREKKRPELTEEIKNRLSQMRQSGATAKTAVAAVAEQTGVSKKELYQAWLRRQ
ncbi:16S rRNA (cytidine(1402)-2'-O)-methyltransferase [Chloroflexota bacterium]